MTKSLLELPEQTESILDAMNRFMDKEVVETQDAVPELFEQPHRMYTPAGRYSDEVLRLRKQVRMASATHGYYHLCVPERLGGGGEGGLTWFAVWENVFHRLGARYSVLAHEIVSHWAKGPSLIFEGASPRIRETVLPELMSGETSMCFGMSEPEAGSDVWGMKTRATRDGGSWLISGAKQWITNAPYADHCLIFAVTDPEAVAARRGGISVFVVPMDAPGFAVDSVIRLYGHPGGNEGAITLDAVRVDDDALVGTEGEGLRIGLAGLALGRLYNAAKSVGLARWGLEQAVSYSKERHTFGQPLMANQSISFMLVDAATEVLNAHLLGLHAAQLFDAGEDALIETSMAKMYGTEMGCRVLDRAVQIHGGMGLTNELGLSEAWQELRTVQIADGSAEMLRRIVGRRLGKQLPPL